MIVIEQPNLYKCEICGFTHESKALIELHEANKPLPPSRLKSGDVVWLVVQYDGFIKRTVTDVKIGNCMTCTNFNFVEDKYLKRWGNDPCHRWNITVDKDVQVGDGFDGLTDIFVESELILESDLKWHDVYENPNTIPEPNTPILIEYINDEIHMLMFNSLESITKNTVKKWASVPSYYNP
jgi:hypothetical protein